MSLAIRWTPVNTSSPSQQASAFNHYLSVEMHLVGRTFTLIVTMDLALSSVEFNAEDVVWRNGHFVNLSFAEKATVDWDADLIPDWLGRFGFNGGAACWQSIAALVSLGITSRYALSPRFRAQR